MRAIGLLLLAVTVSLLSGCDPITPPFMRNALTVPIHVNTRYADGTVVSDVWQPQMRVACGRQTTEIIRFTVRTGGHVIHDVRAEDIRRLARSVRDLRKVTLEVRRDAIVPVPNS